MKICLHIDESVMLIIFEEIDAEIFHFMVVIVLIMLV